MKATVNVRPYAYEDPDGRLIRPKEFDVVRNFGTTEEAESWVTLQVGLWAMKSAENNLNYGKYVQRLHVRQAVHAIGRLMETGKEFTVRTPAAEVTILIA